MKDTTIASAHPNITSPKNLQLYAKLMHANRRPREWADAVLVHLYHEHLQRWWGPSPATIGHLQTLVEEQVHRSHVAFRVTKGAPEWAALHPPMNGVVRHMHNLLTTQSEPFLTIPLP